MDLRRFLDLYVAETQEHVRALQRSLLALDEQAGGAIDEAFRSAHTIKGLSAAMGYGAVADRAHALEDVLDRVRLGAAAVDATLVDALLADVDALEAGIADAVATIPPRLDGGPVAEATAPPVPVVPVAAPPGTAHVLVVTLAPDAPIKAARAVLILRGLEREPQLVGASPQPIPDDFDGTLHLFLGPGADVAALQAQVAGAGDVASVAVAQPIGATAARPRPEPALPPPTRQVRVDEARLDRLAEGIGELSVLKNRLASLPVDPDATTMIDRMDSLLSELQQAVLAMRMVPLSESFERLPRVVRDAARRTGKEVELRIEGESVELDRSILNEIADPLIHLLRNAVDHGIERPEERERLGKRARGLICITAERERSSVRIVIEDDGAGVDRERVMAKAKRAGLLPADRDVELTEDELFRLLSHPGFSTAEQVSDVSGRGVGLDAVVNRIRSLGGAVDMHSLHGHGTTLAIRLPITLALAQALRVRVGGEEYAVPLTHVAEVIDLDGALERDGSRELVRVRDQLLPLVRLSAVLGLPGRDTERCAVIAEFGDRRAALGVDALVGHEQVLVKGFDPAPGTLPVFSGATLLQDGRPALVLDPLSVM